MVVPQIQFGERHSWQPFESILADMNRALEANLFYPALVVALTIPDVCAGLALDDTQFLNQATYAAFVNKYAPPKGSEDALGVNGIECYRLRGGIIHRGNAAGHPFSGLTHVMFTVPESGGYQHDITIIMEPYKGLLLDLPQFCAAMEIAARRWLEEHQDNQKVRENVSRLLSTRPNGLPPILDGQMVIGSGKENRNITAALTVPTSRAEKKRRKKEANPR